MIPRDRSSHRPAEPNRHFESTQKTAKKEGKKKKKKRPAIVFSRLWFAWRNLFMGRQLVSGARHFVFQTAQSCSPSIQTQKTAFLRFNPSRARPLLSFLSSSSSSRRAFATFRSLQQYPASPPAMADLPVTVEGLSLQSTTETSKFAGCFPALNPVDIYREHIAEKLSEGTGIEAEKIYSRLMWTSTLDKGDLVLPVCATHSIIRYFRGGQYGQLTHLPY